MNKPHFNTDAFRADSAAGMAPKRPATADSAGMPRRAALAAGETTPAANSADTEALRRPSGDVVDPASDDAARRLHWDVPPSARTWSC